MELQQILATPAADATAAATTTPQGTTPLRAASQPPRQTDGWRDAENFLGRQDVIQEEQQQQQTPPGRRPLSPYDIYTANLGQKNRIKANLLLQKLALFPDVVHFDDRGRVYTGDEMQPSLNIGIIVYLSSNWYNCKFSM